MFCVKQALLNTIYTFSQNLPPFRQNVFRAQVALVATAHPRRPGPGPARRRWGGWGGDISHKVQLFCQMSTFYPKSVHFAKMSTFYLKILILHKTVKFHGNCPEGARRAAAGAVQPAPRRGPTAGGAGACSRNLHKSTHPPTSTNLTEGTQPSGPTQSDLSARPG